MSINKKNTTADTGITLNPIPTTGITALPRSAGALYFDNTLNEPVFDNGTTVSPFGGGSGANTALSNLASVSINTPLIPQSNIDLGGPSNLFRFLYAQGWQDSSGNELIDVSRILLSTTGRTQLDWATNNILNANFSNITNIADLRFALTSANHNIQTADQTGLSHTSDDLTISTGNTDAQASGNLTITTGTMASTGGGSTGAIVIVAGNSADNGGGVELIGGSSSSVGAGGSAVLQAGGGAGGGGGGDAVVSGGGTDTGTPGNVQVRAGQDNVSAYGNVFVDYGNHLQLTGHGTNARVELIDTHLSTNNSSRSSPTIAIQSAAGTGSSASVASSSDIAGKITINTGTVGISTGAYAIITFNKVYNFAPIVMITSANSSLTSSIYITSTVNDFTVNFVLSASISTTYLINYFCIEPTS